MSKEEIQTRINELMPKMLDRTATDEEVREYFRLQAELEAECERRNGNE